jgi:2'-5' RNA ligase
MKRIFAALKIEPGDLFSSIISSMVTKLGNEKITWVSTDNIHLTMAFLGDTEEERIKIAGLVLKQKCSGFGEFDFIISGTGVYKSLREPKVIWAGIEYSERLISLNKMIVNGLLDTGFNLDERPFRPHITLGRIRSIKDHDTFRTIIEKNKETKIQKIHVDSVILFESILKPEGPVYNPIGKFKLS